MLVQGKGAEEECYGKSDDGCGRDPQSLHAWGYAFFEQNGPSKPLAREAQVSLLIRDCTYPHGSRCGSNPRSSLILLPWILDFGVELSCSWTSFVFLG